MIELLTADTPNGKKISIMLEEIQFKYKITKINILKEEQFKQEFKKHENILKFMHSVEWETPRTSHRTQRSKGGGSLLIKIKRT
mgnify:CR=1 FL=1